MNDQARLFDVAEGERRSLEGMANASRADRVAVWRALADEWFYGELVDGEEIAADDLIAAVGVADTGANQNNVVGAWFNAKARAGELEYAGRARKSRRVARHVGMQRVWTVRR